MLTIYDATWANVRSTSSYANAYTYTGRQLDTETGLFYYRARFYAPQLGRFCSRDPAEYLNNETNLFSITKSSPINYRDPEGLTSVPEIRPPADRTNNITSVRMVCRTMPRAWHFPGMTHCYLVFTDANGNIVDVLSGQQIDGRDPICLGLSDRDWDEDYFRGLNPARQTEYPVVVPVGASLCSIYDCMYREARRWHCQSVYNQFTNNSNTFLSWMIAPCGLTVQFPWSAIGSDNPGPCMMRCLNGQNIISAPEWRIRECSQRCSALEDGGTPYEPPDPFAGAPPTWNPN
ncbi:MAG: RHS repeat-associated core domain-containing protein [Pirellulaceae bacterium]